MKKPELLSPAGNMECLKAAIEGGCDAVYLGGYIFGARSYAGNFSNEELEKAITYAHLYGVKVYITVNTLVYENEVPMFLNYIDFLVQIHVDALIMQDLGMMDLVRQTYPELEIHASTQMHIHNIEGVKAAQKLGLSRVVLARETDIDTIEIIKNNTQMELEIFIHGALCFCYSGQCLMSSMIGGRSGNRGTCTQCCRMPYSLYDKNEKINENAYVLSPKDLNSLENIGKLIDIGVDSLKIEGRMKRAEYVYYVTYLYRRAIDEYCMDHQVTITEGEMNTLKKLFHREFTKGFLFHETTQNWLNPRRPNHIGITVGKVLSYEKGWITCQLTDTIHQNDGIRILGKKEDNGCILNKMYRNQKLVHEGNPKDIISFYLKGNFQKGDSLLLTSDQQELNAIDKLIHSNRRKVSIKGKVILKIGEVITYQISDGKNQVIVYGEQKVESALHSPVTKERIEVQLKKLGDTVYQLTELEIDMEESIFIPMLELNQLRRDVVEILNQKRIERTCYRKKIYHLEVPEWNESFGYSIRVQSEEKWKQMMNYPFKTIYIEDRILYEQLKNHDNVSFILPRVEMNFLKVDGNLMGSELGSLFYYRPTYSNFSFHATNSYTVAFLHNQGVKRITLSLELNEIQIEELYLAYLKRYRKKPNLEVFITHYPEVMITAFDLLSYYKTSNRLSMIDEKKHKFQIEKNGQYTRIYYEKNDPLLSCQKLKEIGIQTICLSDRDSNLQVYFS